MMVLTLPTRYLPALTPVQTAATGHTAESVAELLREVVLHESAKASNWRPAARAAIRKLSMECGTPNWDGYGAAPLSEDARRQAEQFIDLLPTDLPEPEVAADPDGDVSLYWECGPGHMLTISIGAQTISYAGILGRGVRRHGQEPFRGDVAKVLLESIREVCSERYASS